MMLIERLAATVVADWNKGDASSAIEALAKHLAEMKQERLNHEGTISCARSNYVESAGEEIAHMIEDEPLLCVKADGVWVGAWVWVPIEVDAELD